MTHMPYIMASYSIFGAIAAALALSAYWRLRRAATRLRAVDPRAQSADGMA